MNRLTLRFASLPLLALPVLAHAQLFDFESTPTTSDGSVGRPGALTSLAVTSGGLTLTLSREGGTAFDVMDNTSAGQGGKPASWGNHTLDPFFAGGPNTGFIGNFSGLVTSVALEFGDYNSDEDNITLSVWSGLNGTGSLLGTISQTLPTSDFFGGSLSLSAAGIQSFTLSSSNLDVFPNTVFVDNITVSRAPGVPGPAAVAPFVIGLISSLRRRRA